MPTNRLSHKTQEYLSVALNVTRHTLLPEPILNPKKVRQTTKAYNPRKENRVSISYTEPKLVITAGQLYSSESFPKKRVQKPDIKIPCARCREGDLKNLLQGPKTWKWKLGGGVALLGIGLLCFLSVSTSSLIPLIGLISATVLCLALVYICYRLHREASASHQSLFTRLRAKYGYSESDCETAKQLIQTIKTQVTNGRQVTHCSEHPLAETKGGDPLFQSISEQQIHGNNGWQMPNDTDDRSCTHQECDGDFCCDGNPYCCNGIYHQSCDPDCGGYGSKGCGNLFNC